MAFVNPKLINCREMDMRQRHHVDSSGGHAARRRTQSACLDAGDLSFGKACGGERGGPGWGDADESMKRCDLEI